MEQVEVFAGGEHQVELLIPGVAGNIHLLQLNIEPVRLHLFVDCGHYLFIILGLCAG
ncbi:hypothetical protein D3C81_2259690 [compost metagenome]